MSLTGNMISRAKADLNAVIACRDAEMHALEQRYAPIIAPKQAIVDEYLDLDRELNEKFKIFLDSVRLKPLHEFEAYEVKALLNSAKIDFSEATFVSNQVSGEVFAECRDELTAQEMLGIPSAGDCARAVNLVRHIQNGKGIPETLDIEVDGPEDDPSKWSVHQIENWASGNSLADVSHELRRHKLAGDVLASLDASSFLPLLKLTFKQMNAFRKETAAFRAMIVLSERAPSCDDDLTG